MRETMMLFVSPFFFLGRPLERQKIHFSTLSIDICIVGNIFIYFFVNIDICITICCNLCCADGFNTGDSKAQQIHCRWSISKIYYYIYIYT